MTSPPIETYHIAAFYHFFPVAEPQVPALAEQLEVLGRKLGLKGLIIFAREGINGTISGETKEQVISYLALVSDRLGFPLFTPKWSESLTWPFRKFKVRVREEIVTLGNPEVGALPP